MSQAEEESKRVSLQVSSLSTQLIESIEKQSRLEEQLLQYKRENDQLKAQSKDVEQLRTSYQSLQITYQEILVHNNGLGKKLETEAKDALNAKEEVSKLQSEVQELSASLFGEANKMVNDARRVTAEVEKRNESLVSQLKEKDLLLDSLQTQLKALKETLHERDSDSVLSTRDSFDELRPRYSKGSASNSSSQVKLPLSQPQLIIYSPTTDSIRFDLEQYSEYQKFVKVLPGVDSIRHTDTKFLKRLILDDVDPALRIDLAPGISWLSKRSLMSSIIDGRVAIEPISGINETYRLNFQTNKPSGSDVRSNLYSYPSQSPPVAINEPCALCGEERDDILEHSRLYVMKLHPKADSTSTANLTGATNHQYPLCSYCLFRIRSASDLFAFLRSLKTDAWKLQDEVTIKKSWVELSRLRSKLFWSKIGIWDTDSNIVTTHITPLIDEKLIQKGLNVSNDAIISTPGEIGTRGTPLNIELKEEDLSDYDSANEGITDDATIKFSPNNAQAEVAMESSYEDTSDIVDEITESYGSPDGLEEEKNNDDDYSAPLDEFINDDSEDEDKAQEAQSPERISVVERTIG